MESQKAYEILNRAKEQDKIICLYTSCYSEKFAAGFVEAISDKHVVIRSLSVHGRYDGWLLRKLDDVPRMDWGGRYEESLLFLARARKTTHPDGFLFPIGQDTNLISDFLLAAQQHDCMASLDTGSDANIVGFIKSVEATTVTVEIIDTNGENNGESVVELDAIERVDVDDEDLQDLKLLARWHESEPPAW